MSKEEAEQEEKRRRSDDLRLQMALSQSEQEFRSSPPPTKNESALVDLLDVELGATALPLAGIIAGDPWAPLAGGSRSDPWNSGSSSATSPQDPWISSAGNIASASGVRTPNSAPIVTNDPWLSATPPPLAEKPDPWNPNRSSPMMSSGGAIGGGEDEDEFDTISKRTGALLSESSVFNMDHLSSTLLQPSNSNSVSPAFGQHAINHKMTPVGFLGENSSLVNLDNLLPSSNNRQASSPVLGGLSGSGLTLTQNGSSSAPNVIQNPFAPMGTSLLTSGISNQSTVNPFHVQNAVLKPSINEIREKQQKLQIQGIGPGQQQVQPSLQPQNNPWSPVKTENPFLN